MKQTVFAAIFLLVAPAFSEGLSPDEVWAAAQKQAREKMDAGDWDGAQAILDRAKTMIATLKESGSDSLPASFEAPDIVDLRARAEQGDAQAQYDLGIRYLHGQGVKQDFAKTAEWYRKAAEQGHVFAQGNLGFAYENGRGVEQNYAKAVDWYRKAAEQGNAEAQKNLGRCYDNGVGVERNISESMKWYRKAAEQGSAEAQTFMGFSFYNIGQFDAAVEWFRKAAAQGHEPAKDALKTLGLSETP